MQVYFRQEIILYKEIELNRLHKFWTSYFQANMFEILLSTNILYHSLEMNFQLTSIVTIKDNSFLKISTYPIQSLRGWFSKRGGIHPILQAEGKQLI